MEEAVLTGRIDAPGFFDDPLIRDAWLHATWTGPVRMSLQPKLDAEADKIDAENGVKTRQQIMTERTGGDFDQKMEQAKRENAAMKDAGYGDSAAAAPPPAPEPDPDSKEDDDA